MPRYRIEMAREIMPDYAYVTIEAPTFAQAESMAIDDAENNRVMWYSDQKVKQVYVTDIVRDGSLVR